ncbi:MAG: thioredoxin family protein [Polyangiaceae bacterium]|nr:thioredoxin family protein [Polyangiaceae bacterium]
MARARSPIVAALATLLAACDPLPPVSPQPTPAPPALHTALAPTASVPVPAPPGPVPEPEGPEPTPVSLPVIEDDLAAAFAEARSSGRLVFVEAWAEWCHTCLSMRNYVLPDPSLVPLGTDVVMAAIDTDRDENAAFLKEHVVNVWPTLLLLDPESSQVLGYWQGAASVAELRRFVRQAVELRQALRQGSTDPLVVGLVEAKRAQAGGKYQLASQRFADLARRAPRDWPARSEVLYGWLAAEYRRGRWLSCADVGTRHLDEIEGAALPADASYVLLECAGRVGGNVGGRAADKALARLRAHTDAPPADASVDDRADALSTLAEALSARGDKAGARAATERRLALMEEAARQAPSPRHAAVFDYGRLGAYLALGRGDDAVQMFAARTRDMPDSYEAWARYASVLSQLKRYPEARTAVERAIALAYGPRRLTYQELRASLLVRMGELEAARQAFVELVQGYEALPDTPALKKKKEAGLREARAKVAALSAR